jgi:hypothetical protein
MSFARDVDVCVYVQRLEKIDCDAHITFTIFFTLSKLEMRYTCLRIDVRPTYLNWVPTVFELPPLLPREFPCIYSMSHHDLSFFPTHSTQS